MSRRSVLAWGLHSDGQGGVGTVENPSHVDPTPVVGAEHYSISMVASGFRHTLLVMSSGQVFACGFARFGRLGLDREQIGSAEKMTIPAQVKFSVKIDRVSCGFGHSAAVSADGHLYTWGYAGDGALGLGPLSDNVWEPTLVPGLPAMQDVSCGGVHTMALAVSGVLYCAGSEAAVGQALSGDHFKSWEGAGEVSLICAGSKNCMVVSESRPHDVYVFGTSQLGCMIGLPARQEPYEPTLVAVGCEGRIAQIASTRFGVLKDDAGGIYISGEAGWRKLLMGDRRHASTMALGVLTLVFLDTATRSVLSLSLSLAAAAAAAGEVVPADKISIVQGLKNVEAIYAGHRTLFAVAVTELRGTNRDAFGKLRSSCRSCGEEKCPRFAGSMSFQLNDMKAAIKCLRCGCDANVHVEAAETEIKGSLSATTVRSSPPPPYSASAVEWPTVKEDRDESAVSSLPECKNRIQALQKQCKRIKVPDTTRMRVFAVSDIHTDFRGNMLWLQDFVAWAGAQFLNDACIIAGDISHDMDIIEATLRLFSEAFGYVFHICGNHELWVIPKTDTVKHGYHKMVAVQELCQRLGVYCHPVIFEDAASNRPLVVAPLLTWYEPQFCGRTTRAAMEGFDMACRWPEEDVDITSFTLSCNPIHELNQMVNLKSCRVATFSHFIPRTELFFGWPALREVMGSTRIDQQVRQLSSQVHVFGHSHMDVDRKVDGIRYVQHALGSEPRHRTQSSFPSYKPIQIL